MISFASDYVAGAHPKILARLLETNLENLPGYGTDKYCEQARQKIVLACGCPEAQVDFLVGGTQTNAVIINSLLPNYAGAVAADTGHISCHEAGAIEAGGHKVITLPHRDGKLAAEPLRRYLADFYADANYEHMVQPGLVYISHPTEYGTLYSKQELQALAAVCREYQLPLFLDGARLGYALASRQTDVGLPDIAALCDVFYIGGTKVGVALQKEYKKVANKIHIHQQKSFVFYLQLWQKKNRKKRLRNLFKSFLNAFFNQFFRSCRPFAFLHNPAKSGVCQAYIPANLINYSPEHCKFYPNRQV